MKTITKSQYMQLVGLLAVGANLNARLKDVLDAMGEITQETDFDCGHTSDVLYCNESADQLLKRLDIKVKR